jgi:hypothetical protein
MLLSYEELELAWANGVNHQQHPLVCREGWMVKGQETVFCWVLVPQLAMVVSSVAFSHYLFTKQPTSRLLVGR